MKVGISFTAEILDGQTGMLTFVIDKECIAMKTKDIFIHHWSSEVLPNASPSQTDIYSTRSTAH